MVDPIGLKPVSTSDRKVAAPTRVAPPATPASVTVQPQPAAPTPLTQEVSARPPIDHERVARIRKAIAEGNFPIYPATIADRMIAFKLDWTPNDPQ